MAKIAVAFWMIWFLLHQGTLDFSLFLEGAVNLRIIAVGLLLNLLMLSFGALRWHIILGSQGIVLPFSWVHSMIYLTMCFNLLVPGAVGGDVLRMNYVVRKAPAAQKGAAILTIIVDRFTGLYSLFVIALLAILVNLPAILTILPLRLLTLSLLLVVGGGPLAIILLFWAAKHIPMLSQRLNTNPDAFESKPSLIDTVIYQTAIAVRLFRQTKVRLLAALAVSAIAQIIEIFALLWIARELQMLTFSANSLFVAAPLAWVANVLPISPGGLGVGEAAFAQICQWLQPIPSTTAFGTIFLVNRILQMLASLPGLWVYLLYRHEPLPKTPAQT